MKDLLKFKEDTFNHDLFDVDLDCYTVGKNIIYYDGDFFSVLYGKRNDEYYPFIFFILDDTCKDICTFSNLLSYGELKYDGDGYIIEVNLYDELSRVFKEYIEENWETE